MREKFLELTKQEVVGFMPVSYLAELPGLTPRNLWDICDIAVRFGCLDVDMRGKPGMFFAHRNLRVEVYNFLGNGVGGSAGMLIGKHRPNRDFQCTEEGTFIVELLNDMTAMWDRGFTVREIQALMHEIDQISYARGHILAGQRRILNEG